MTENYLEMISESLQKKIGILQELEQICKQQKELFDQGEQMDEDAFDTSVERKGELIDEVEKLDDGFTALFEKVKEQIGNDKAKYAEQIGRIQGQIREITSVSNAIEAQEKRNKLIADRYFERARNVLQKGRQSSGTALLYHQTMNHAQSVTPQFFDSKK